MISSPAPALRGLSRIVITTHATATVPMNSSGGHGWPGALKLAADGSGKTAAAGQPDGVNRGGQRIAVRWLG